MRGRVVALAVVGLLAACSSGSSTTAGTAPTASSGVTTTTAPVDVPASCNEAVPAASATVTFVAHGHAWAMDADRPGEFTCLFAVDDPGFFSWGPQGDRVVLHGLAVRGVGSDVTRPAADLHPSYFSWSRPAGTTVVFTDQDQRTLTRADMNTAKTRDITPLPGVRYGDMAYHPSGLAIAFVVTDASGVSAIWMAGNQGTDPRVLVQAADPDTRFEHIVFAKDGVGLYYTADFGDGQHSVLRYDLTANDAGLVATVDAPVVDVVETLGRAPAFTVGATCAEHRALLSTGTSVVPLGADLAGPVSLVGRLDERRFVVSAGGCGAPADVYVVTTNGIAPQLLVRGVDTVALRVPEPSPPPPLPQNLPTSGFA